jgi:hypothetical protein
MDIAAGHRRKLLAVLTAVLVLAFVAVGCSSDDSGSSSSSSSSTSKVPSDPTKPPPCPSASDVDKILKAGLDTPQDDVNGSIRTCTYNTTAGGDEVVIRFETGVSAADFATTAQSPGPSGEAPTAVTGLGDAAFTMRRDEPGGAVTEVAAISGTTVVSVLAPVSVSDVEALVRSLLDSI